MEHLRPNAIDDSEGYLGSILRGVDMYAKRALAEGRIDNLDDGFRDSANVGVVGHDGGEGLLDSLAITFIWSRFVLRQARLIGRRPGMREVVGAFGERARHDNGRFDTHSANSRA